MNKQKPKLAAMQQNDTDDLLRGNLKPVVMENQGPNNEDSEKTGAD
jgi:hypothetical protein